MAFARAITYTTVFEIVLGLLLLPAYYFTEHFGFAFLGLFLFVFGGVANAVLLVVFFVFYCLDFKNKNKRRDSRNALIVLALSFLIGFYCYQYGTYMTNRCDVTLSNKSSKVLKDVAVLLNAPVRDSIRMLDVLEGSQDMDVNSTRGFSFWGRSDSHALVVFTVDGKKHEENLLVKVDVKTRLKRD